MNSNIIYQTNNTTITYSTIKRGTSVYQISQINDIYIDNDSYFVDRKFDKEKSQKKSAIIKGILTIIVGLILIIAGAPALLFFIAVIIGGLMIFFSATGEVVKKDITYTLHVSFVNGARLELNGEKEVIYDIKEAITIAMES